ncbi:MAG: SDR family NAD(P)-dependent oxidoreductase, partial [Armatimonadetes bacterium]|nr:SDR family NAD(P)-dependent oxidoreductase [Anaerolineae bacterium]
MKQAKETVVLITGSNSGIGNATAKLAAAAGYITYGGARREATFGAIQAVGAHPIALDVTDDAMMRAAVAEIEAKHGAVDVLINNAGYGQMGPIEHITREQWLQQYDINVFGLARMAQLVIPAMRRQGSGRIINISSAGGEFTFPLAGAYHSTKYAVESINAALRLELKPFGIQVVTIQPGPVATPLAQSAA